MEIFILDEIQNSEKKTKNKMYLKWNLFHVVVISKVQTKDLLLSTAAHTPNRLVEM